MEQTKITIKVWEKLLDQFNKNLDESFIKRDAYLNHILKTETKFLREEMKELKLSSEARRYISSELKHLGTKTINVTVDKDTADNLNDIVSKSNMVRDAFINRLMLLLTLRDKQLEVMLKLHGLRNYATHNDEPLPLSPAECLREVSNDPLYYVRSAVDYEKEKGLYLTELEESKFSSGMTCYLNDSNVPGTEAYKTAQAESEKSLNEFLSFDLSGLNSLNTKNKGPLDE